MNDEEACRRLLERLIRAENQGGKSARDEAEEVLDEVFLGITRGKGREQSRKDYLDELQAADQAGSGNNPRWLDIADPNSAPDLVEPGSNGPRLNSAINTFGGTAVMRVVVTTHTAQELANVLGRYRNLFVLIRRGETWKLLAWQVTELPKESQ
jgi:hypothetical protein